MRHPVALYVHVPWCVRKCPYCDFNSHEAGGELPETEYLDALLGDLEAELAITPATDITSIFIGGGTPSLLSGATYDSLLTGIRDQVPINPGAEITMEANPGTIEGVERLHAFRQAGINRLSLGVQSFDDDSLTRLGRIHSGEDVGKAYRAARDAGFENINLDLMHGLPGQDLGLALDDLARAIALGPEHLSWYQLTIEPGTVFYKRPPTLPSDEILWEIFERGSATLAAAGYQQYETSAFATEGNMSKHNLNYWQFGDYLGIGAGAHGKISLAGAGIIRTQKTRLPADYLRAPKRLVTPVAHDELMLEYLMNALRLWDGFSLRDFTARTGLAASHLDGFLERATRRELIEHTGNQVRASELGQRFLNDLLMMVDDSVIKRS